MNEATFKLIKQNTNITNISAPPTLEEAISMYAETIESLDGLRPNTLKHYRHDLELFVRFIHDYTEDTDITVDAVTPHHIDAFFRELKIRGNADTSLRRRLSALRRFFKRMVSWGYLDSSPVAHFRTRVVEAKTPVILTKRECKRLLQGAKMSRFPIRDYTMFRLFLVSACTLSELINLRKEDINLSKRKIRFCGRGNVSRVIEVSTTTRDLLSDYLSFRDKAPAHPHALFLNRHGDPVTKGAIYHAFRLALAAGKIDKPGLSIHSLRHTSLAMLWQSGVSLHVLQHFAGHQSISTTRAYRWAGPRPRAPRRWQSVHPLEKSLGEFWPSIYSARITGFSNWPIPSISQTIVSPGFK